MPTIINGQINQNHQPLPHINQASGQDSGCGTAEDCAIACRGIVAAIPQAMRNLEVLRHIFALHDCGLSHHTQLTLGPLHRLRLGAALCQKFIKLLFVLRRAQVVEEIVKGRAVPLPGVAECLPGIPRRRGFRSVAFGALDPTIANSRKTFRSISFSAPLDTGPASIDK